jgi:hypothetical protein
MLVRRSVSLPRRVFGARGPLAARAFGVPFRSVFRGSPWRRSFGFRGPFLRTFGGRPWLRGPVLRGPVLRGPLLRGPLLRGVPWARGPFLRSAPWARARYGFGYAPGVRTFGQRPWLFRQPLPWYPPPLLRRWPAPAYPYVDAAPPPIVEAPPVFAPPVVAAPAVVEPPPAAEPPPEGAAEPPPPEPAAADGSGGKDAAPAGDAAGGAPPAEGSPPAGELPDSIAAAGQRVRIRWDPNARELGSSVPPGGGVYIVLSNGRPESVHLTTNFRQHVAERFGAEPEPEAEGESIGEHEAEGFMRRRRWGFRRRGSRRSFRFGRFGGARLGRSGRIGLLRSLRRIMLQQGAPPEPEPEPQEPPEGDDQERQLL